MCRARTKPCFNWLQTPAHFLRSPVLQQEELAAECSAVKPDEGIATSRTQWEQQSTCVLLPSSTGSLPNFSWLCTCCPSTVPRDHPPGNSPQAACSPHHILAQKPQPDPATHLYLSAWEGVTAEALSLSYKQGSTDQMSPWQLTLYLIIDRKQLLLQLLCHLTRDLPSLLQVLILPAKRPKESHCL